MDERLQGREYYLELRAVRDALVKTVGRVGALDQEEKPEALAGTLSLGELVYAVDHAIELAEDAISAAQMTLAVEGVRFEDQAL